MSELKKKKKNTGKELLALVHLVSGIYTPVTHRQRCTGPQSQKGSSLGLVLYHHHLEILNNIWIRAHEFPFALGPNKFCSQFLLSCLVWSEQKAKSNKWSALINCQPYRPLFGESWSEGGLVHEGRTSRVLHPNQHLVPALKSEKPSILPLGIDLSSRAR